MAPKPAHKRNGHSRAASKARPAAAIPSQSKPRATPLAQEIVIEGAPASARTGAEAIAPDHVPRSIVPASTRSAAAQARRAPGPVDDVVREIEQLLYRQSELLDQKAWQDYIDLFADDGVYWMPAAPEQTDWQSEPSIFAEDKHMMEVRMGRVTHPTAWSQVPLWATSHVVGNVVIESQSNGEYQVRSRFHMMELRRDDVRHFGGTYRHTLVRDGVQLRIKLQRVDMFNVQAPYEYVLQVWV